MGGGAKRPIIGIDFGSSKTCIGVWQRDHVEIIANDQGNRTTPSYVSFYDDKRLIGDAAKNQVALNPSNTVYDAKRLIGRRFNDATVQNDMKLWSFKVVPKDEKPLIQVTFKGEVRTFTAEEISAMVLTKMKETAEAYLGREVKNAVITCPTNFGFAQRDALKKAAAMAGFDVKRMMKEPTACGCSIGIWTDI